MLKYRHDDREFEIRHSSWMLAALFMLIPPALIYELGPALIDGTIDKSDLAGLVIGIVGPLLGAYFLVEFGEFRFTLDDNRFRWRWRNLLRREQGEVPLERVIRVRRDALESSNSSGLNYTYRLIVILDDDRIIPLSRGYSGLYDRVLDKIVDQLRGFLGHVERMR